MRQKNFKDIFRQWKWILQDCLGGKMSHKVANIALDILCVDVGLKPGFLFDYGTVSVEQMGHLLQSLHKENLTSNKNLCAICVNSDVIVVNPGCLEQYLDFVRAHASFIDVSAKHEVPCLIDGNKDQIIPSLTTADVICTDLRTSVTTGNSYIAHIELSANVSTIYGLLLGYPVIYWYEQSDSEDVGLCLSMEPLRNFKVWGSIPPNTWNPVTSQFDHTKGHYSVDKHPVYSFTVPERIMDDVKCKIEDWMRKICELNTCKGVFTHLDWTQFVTTEPVIVL